MTMQQLKYFLDASKSLNFTKTAEAFFISQSAVTPVSYTHLDVYKRQEWCPPPGRSCRSDGRR